MTGVAGDLDNATATLMKVVHGTTDISTVSCGPDGIRSDSTWGDFAGLSWQFEFGPGWERTAVTGVWLLPASELVPGARWSYHSAYANNQGRIAARDETFTVAGLESFTLDSQTVEALRMDRTLGYGAIPDASGSGSDWLVRGIGLVKWEGSATTGGVTGSSNLELRSYSVP